MDADKNELYIAEEETVVKLNEMKSEEFLRIEAATIAYFGCQLFYNLWQVFFEIEVNHFLETTTNYWTFFPFIHDRYITFQKASLFWSKHFFAKKLI